MSTESRASTGEGYTPSSARDLMRIVFKHFRKGFVTFVACGLLVAIAIQCWPLEYRSEAKLLVRLGRSSVGLDPAAALGPRVNVTQSRESQIKSELQIVRSADLLREVVVAVGRPGLATDASDANAVERAVERLDKHLRVSVEPDSNVVALSVRADTPELAQTTLQTLIDRYLARHNTIHMISGAGEFFQRQVDQADKEVTENRQALDRYEADNQLYDLEGQRLALLAQIASRNGERAQVLGQIALVSARVRAMHARLEGNSDTALPEVGPRSTAATQAVRSRLVDLRLQESELQSKYPGDSRPVQLIRQQISLAEQLLAQEQQAVSDEGVNAVREQIRADLDRDKITLAGFESQLETLELQLEEFHTSIRKLNDYRERVLDLNAEIELGLTNRQRYREGLEQSRIDAALDAEKISNVRIVQRPSRAIDPSGLPKTWLLGIGLLIALFAAAGVIGFAEFVDDSLCTTDDVSRRLGLTAVASLPDNPELRKPLAKRIWDGSMADDLSVQTTTAAEVVAARLRTDAGNMSFGVIADRPGVGVTTVTLHLAMALARGGTTVLLIDANDKDPVLSKSLTEEKLTSWGVPGLFVCKRPLASGPAAVTDLVRRLPAWHQKVAVVLVDLPSIATSPTTLQMARRLDNTVLVVDAGKTRWRTARQTAELLAETGSKLTSVVLNRRRFPVPGWLYRWI